VADNSDSLGVWLPAATALVDHPTMAECPECGKFFASRALLGRHGERAHKTKLKKLLGAPALTDLEFDHVTYAEDCQPKM
jgi:hypothetical protein